MRELLQYEDLIGVPFKRNGKSPDEGFDCYWLCWYLRERINRPIPEKEFSAFRVVRSGDVEKFKARFVRLKKPQPYCLVYFRRGELESHVGLVLADCNRFIEVDDKIGVHVERLNAPWVRIGVDAYYDYQSA